MFLPKIIICLKNELFFRLFYKPFLHLLSFSCLACQNEAFSIFFFCLAILLSS